MTNLAEFEQPTKALILKEHLDAQPEERGLISTAMLNQAQLAGALQNLTSKQRDFLRFRALTATDIEAAHLAGAARGNDQLTGFLSQKLCGCRRRQRGWADLRPQTILDWKKKPAFRLAYDMLLTEPLVFAATRIEQLAPNAVQVYADLLDPDKPGTLSDKRQAAKDVLQSTGLIRGEGQHRSANAVQETMQFRIARERALRGQEIGDEQRRLLREGGVDPDALPRQSSVVRTLDGDDLVYEDAGEPGDEDGAGEDDADGEDEGYDVDEDLLPD